MLVTQWHVRKLALWFLHIIHNHVSQSEKCIINYYAFGIENCIKCALKVKHALKHVNFNIHVSDSMNIDMCITQLPL